ncbi:MAG: hypothetical protein JSS82_11205 [Bacteroidetes bacterium]|nr:hypothetical protein [Bacteroidota bacterium]
MNDRQVLVLSFYSIGSGINGGEFAEVHDAIERYNKKYAPKLKFSEKQWGMGGEHNICFPPHKGGHFKQFISTLEKQCRVYEHVRVAKNVPCLS